MAEIARKTGGKNMVSAGDFPMGSRGPRTYMIEVTTGGAETSGTVNFATEFGAAGLTGANTLSYLAALPGVTVQQDTGTVVANASCTAAGLVTTGTIVAAKNYWVFAFGI